VSAVLGLLRSLPVATIAQRYDPAYPIDQLHEHPDNPRRGDEEAIEASMAAHGFYGAVLVQTSTNRIIAGNHRTRVAARLGEATVPVLFVDVDDDRARRLLLVDNRSNDLAGYDDRELAALLSEVEDLAGTGFGDEDLAQLLRSLEEPDPSMPRPGDERYTPQWIFDGMGLRFDLDVAAPMNPAERTTPAARHLTIADDGLTAPWEGLVWMNPPYSVAAAWARRWMHHPDGVCVLTVSKSHWVPEMCELAGCFVFVPGIDFRTPFDQTGYIDWMTFMAARGTGTPGLQRLANMRNWPLFTAGATRPRPNEPMDFTGRSR
jgi:hypothetical protein